MRMAVRGMKGSADIQRENVRATFTKVTMYVLSIRKNVSGGEKEVYSLFEFRLDESNRRISTLRVEILLTK
jgi:hypothetical protein